MYACITAVLCVYCACVQCKMAMIVGMCLICEHIWSEQRVNDRDEIREILGVYVCDLSSMEMPTCW